MSASKFCRNFWTFPQRGIKEKSYQANGEIQHRNHDHKVQESLDFYMEEQEHLDVQLVLVSLPESRKRRNNYHLRGNTAQTHTQNPIRPELRLATTFQGADFSDRGNGSCLIRNNGCNVEQKDTSCDSNVVATRVSVQSTPHGTKSNGTPSQVEPIVISNSPPGSTLVTNRSLSHTKYKEKSFACGHCDKGYMKKKHLFNHIAMFHDIKQVTIPTHKNRFSCDQCGMQFRLDIDLSSHKFTHSRKETFSCKICNESFLSERDLSSHGKFHEVSEVCREIFPCRSCNKVFIHRHLLNDHMKVHTAVKNIVCSICDRRFDSEVNLRLHMTMHRETCKQLLRDDDNNPGITKNNVPIQFATSREVKEFDEDNSKTDENTTQEIILPTKNCAVLIEQLPDNIGHMGNKGHPFRLEESQAQEEPCVTTVSSGLAKECLPSRTIGERCYNFCSEVASVAGKEVGEFPTLSDAETVSDWVAGSGYSSEADNGERISVEDGIVSKDEASYSDITQPLLVSDQLEVIGECLSASPCHSADDHDTSSSFFGPVESMLSSELPSGSTLVSDQDVVRMKVKEQSLAFPSCVICDICKKAFREQTTLNFHMKLHATETSFKCLLCDSYFPLEIHLHHHMITHKSTCKQMRGDDNNLEESTICEQVRSVLSSSKATFIQCSSKTKEKTTEEPTLSSNNCTALVEQFSQNKDLVEDCKIRTKPSFPTMRSLLENKDNKVVSESKMAILVESQTEDATKTKSGETVGNGIPPKPLNRKRISLAFGIVYEDDVSSPKSPRCSSMKQTLLASAEEVIAPKMVRNKKRSKSLLGFRHIQSRVSPKLPPDATKVTKKGMIHIKDKKVFGCLHCGKTYNNRRSVYSHIRYTHDEKCISCEFCGKLFAQQCLLSEHMIVHTKERPYTCEQCGKSFQTIENLARHKFVHTEARPFVCTICNKSFKNKVHLAAHCKRHERTEYGGPTCNICKRQCANPKCLKQHMMIHSDEMAYSCPLCDKRFRMKIRLQRHMNTHSGLRKACSVCGKTVAANGMYTHMITHAGQKPYGCHICGKRFPQKSNLEGHIRSVHTGEKPFACGGCDKRFALYSNMMTHKAKCEKSSNT